MLLASEAAQEAAHHLDHGLFVQSLILGLLGAMLSYLFKKLTLPEVIGWIAVGLGVSALIYYTHWEVATYFRDSEVVAAFGAFGAFLLLFRIGLESNVDELFSVGASALKVGVLGAVLPLAAGTAASRLYWPDESMTTHVFVGATLMATSVGITMSAMQSAEIDQTREAKVILGAAVIDDVEGLIALAAATAYAISGALIFMTIGKPLFFSAILLGGAIKLGGAFSGLLSWLFSWIHAGTGMKLKLGLLIGAIGAYLAVLLDLEYIIGAFAAGLILDQTHFTRYGDDEVIDKLDAIEMPDEIRTQVVKATSPLRGFHHVEELLKPLAYVFVPIYFMNVISAVDWEVFVNLGEILWPVTGLTLVAVATKLATFFVAPGNWLSRLIVAIGMLARGEVGLVFAGTGLLLGALVGEIFATLIIVVLVTTLISVVLINPLATRFKSAQPQMAGAPVS